MRANLLLAVMLLLAGLGLTAGLEQQDRYRLERAHLAEVQEALTQAGQRLSDALDKIVAQNRQIARTLPEGLSALPRLAQAATAAHPRLVSVVVARQLKIIFVSPELGNEPLIGLDYGLHPEFMGGINRAMQAGDTVSDAPVQLLQTERLGLIVRTPVYDPEGNDSAWGHVAMGVDLEGLLADTGLNTNTSSFHLAIRNRRSDGVIRTLVGNQALFERHHATVLFPVADTSWELAATPRIPMESVRSRAWLVRGLGVSLTLGSLLLFLWRRGVIDLAPPDPAWKGAQGMSLRTLLLMVALIPVPLLVGLAGWLSYSASRHAAILLEQRQVNELGGQLRDKISAFFDVPRRVASLNAEIIRAQLMNPDDPEALARFLVLQVRQQPFLTFLSLGTPQGEYLAASRPPQGSDRSLRLMERRGEDNQVQVYRVDDLNRRGNLVAEGSASFDPRHRPWYTQALESNSLKWYPPARYQVFPSSPAYDTLGMGMSVPLYDSHRRFVGVLTADVALSHLGQFLQEQMAGLDGVAFLAEEKGALLATSGDEKVFDLKDNARLSVDHSLDPHIRAAGTRMAQTLLPEGTAMLDVDGESHLLDWQTLSLPDGPRLRLGIILSEARLAGPVEQAFRTVGYLTFALWLLGIILALFATHALAQPLLALSRWARRLAKGDWQAPPPLESPIHEVVSLTHTLESMADHLRRNTEGLEERVAERTLALEAANRKLEALSVTDGLTGIANRRHFDEVAAAEWSRAERAAQPLTLMMLDVDFFKLYNDHYGHPTGDTALQRVAAVLAGAARRPGDLAARYGGEEFVLLAANTDRAAALVLAEKIRQGVWDLAVAHPSSPYGRLTLSIGLALRDSQGPDTLKALLARADDALYRAKAAGRNKVEAGD
ncbi:diguanylate cyclase [Pararhodospirillum photometricum]|uniref:diguanylate cyclase n=1 Tax=Pararhodospirillum photometricum TaxID=1084 RepID=UPI0002EAE80C|nr:diguanylate cyclase [Pararhodospirillum photometricum]